MWQNVPMYIYKQLIYNISNLFTVQSAIFRYVYALPVPQLVLHVVFDTNRKQSIGGNDSLGVDKFPGNSSLSSKITRDPTGSKTSRERSRPMRADVKQVAQANTTLF